MKRFIILVLMFFALLANAQSVQFDWAQPFLGTGQGMAFGVKQDNVGNVYSVGYFSGTTDFDPGVGTLSFTSGGTGDLFITKLNNKGNLIWAKIIGGANLDQAKAITIDQNNNLVITGNFSGSVDFDPGVGISTLTSSFGTSAFVLKLDSVGNFLWVKQFYGQSQGLAVDIDLNENIVVAGYFNYSVSIGTSTLYGSASSSFVSKLDKIGNVLWAKDCGATHANSLAIDKNKNIFITGDFSGTCDFDPGLLISSMTSKGNSDIFVSKLDSNGSFVWVKQVGGTGMEVAYTLKVDKNSDIVAAGYITASASDSIVDFDPDPGSTYYLSAKGGAHSGFVLKLDNNGYFKWASHLYVTAGNINPNAICTDSSNNIYFTGDFIGNLVFKSEGTSPTYISSAITTRDGFIIMLDSNGKFTWYKELKAKSKSMISSGYAIDVTPSGNSIYSSGYFQGNYDFDPGPLDYSLSSSTVSIYTHRLNKCDIISNIKVTACKSYLSPSKKYVWTISGKYVDKIELLNGCDSVINIDLTVKHLDVNVSNLSPVLTAHEVAASYQWFNCDSPSIVLSTSKTFTASKNGKYKVVISKDVYRHMDVL